MKTPVDVHNQYALKDWDEYVNQLGPRIAALLPLDIDIKDGKVYRARMLSKAVNNFFQAHNSDFPDYLRDRTSTKPTMTEFPNIDKVFKKYVRELAVVDGQQGPDPDTTPLDIITNRPTYMLFRILRDDVDTPTTPDEDYVKWRFSVDKQITCHNDGLGPLRNILPICTLDDGRALLVYNRHRSDPPTIKYDLHLTIHEKVQDHSGTWIDAKTPIIIDPGLGNRGHGIP